MVITKHLFSAVKKVARANHYLVTLNLDGVGTDDLDAAEQMLITEENAGGIKGKFASLCFHVVEMARLDLRGRPHARVGKVG